MSTVSFADELRSRDDAELARLFTLRPDLVTPVPTDFSALAARANSMPSIIRAVDALNKWQLDVLTICSIVNEPFAKSDVVNLSEKGAASVIDELRERGLIYKDGTKFRIVSNVRVRIGDEPAGLGPKAPAEVTYTLSLIHI